MNWTDIAFDCIRSDGRLRQAWAAAFGVRPEAVVVVDDIADENPWADPRVRISLERYSRGGDFPLQIMVLLREDDLEARVANPEREWAVITRLCAELDCRALTANDAANPYEWVLHSPDGETLVVQVDAAQLDDADAFVLLRQPTAAG